MSVMIQLKSDDMLQSVPGVVECLKIVTREKSTRIARFAFDYAIRHGRKKVTAVHKANIMYVWHDICFPDRQKVEVALEFVFYFSRIMSISHIFYISFTL